LDIVCFIVQVASGAVLHQQMGASARSNLFQSDSRCCCACITYNAAVGFQRLQVA
jgi:hypothetical protein